MPPRWGLGTLPGAEDTAVDKTKFLFPGMFYILEQRIHKDKWEEYVMLLSSEDEF